VAQREVDSVGYSNPFSTRFVRPDEMEYRFPAGVDPIETVRRLVERFQTEPALAIVGPHGTGKTTLIHHLIGQLQSTGTAACFDSVDHHRLNSSSKTLGPIAATRLVDSRTLVIIDGFEQMSLATRWAILSAVKCRRDGARLLVTTHRRQWFVPTFFSTSWQADVVRDLTAEKIAHLPMDQRIKMQQVAERLAARYLFGSHVAKEKAASVRDYWFELYDAYEELRPKSSSSPR
jgi:ABC-type branched-subunit amino acid transport system ATPase component